MAEEHEHKEEHKEEHHGEHKGGNTFQKHKTLWIIGGVGAAGVLLLLFMNSGGGSSSQQQQAGTQDLSNPGVGGAVDTSSLVGTGGMPSWYNPGAAENLDYWPYVPSGSGSDSKSGGGSGSGGSKSGGGGSGSKSGGGSGHKTGGGSKSSGGHKTGGGSTSGSKHGGGVTHGSGHHGVSSGSKHHGGTKPNPHAGGAHGYVYTAKAGDTITSLQRKFWPGSSYSSGSGRNTSNTNIFKYGNNSKLIKQGVKSGAIDKYGHIKPGFKLNA